MSQFKVAQKQAFGRMMIKTKQFGMPPSTSKNQWIFEQLFKDTYFSQHQCGLVFIGVSQGAKAAFC